MIKDIDKLYNENNKLKHQITLMKNCENCKYYEICPANFDCIARNFEYWELKECE